MPAPHQITAFPLTIYVAPTGEAMPDVDEAPAGDWLKLGTAGAKDYAEEGVTVTHSQTIETFTGAESTAPRKAFRTEEGLVLAFTLSDLSPEQFATILDDASVTTTAAGSGIPGTKDFDLLRGVGVEQFALLARGQSTIDNALALQYEWPTVFQSGSPAPVFAKGSPAGLAVEFTALEVVAGEFGTLVVQSAVAS